MDQLTALYLILIAICLILMTFLYFKYFRHPSSHSPRHR